MSLENKTTEKIIYKSGEIFKDTGCYSYAGHVEDYGEKCFNPEQTNRMFFKRGEIAPKLISCYHDIKWELIFIY